MPEIVLDGLVKRYGDVTAADGLDLRIEDGEYLCILGPTGSGKTTCLRMICGLTRPDEGTVTFDGTDIGDLPVSERRATMLSQTYSLFPPLTVHENVMFSPSVKGWPEADSRQLVRNMIRMVHMEHKVDNFPRELSGGQQQRTALARALASDSQVLLLDEPLRALDARLRLELRKELRSMTGDLGLTVVHVTHDQDEALDMADRIAVIRQGRIVQVGTPIEVFQEPATPFVANFVGRSNMLRGRLSATVDGISEVELTDGSLVRARGTDLPVGTDVVVAVKIGSTRVTHICTLRECEPEEPLGFFECTVERILYEGANFAMEMEAAGIGMILTRMPNRKYDDYAAGDRVAIDWEPGLATVFAIPEHGLETELRLD
jgi:ABC-type Fe3+/spermidine/putrescine transport system ATPase subunit